MGLMLYIAQAPVNNKQPVWEISLWLLREQINNLVLQLYLLKYILKLCLKSFMEIPLS